MVASENGKSKTVGPKQEAPKMGGPTTGGSITGDFKSGAQLGHNRKAHIRAIGR